VEFSPQLLDALARVWAEAAVDRLLAAEEPASTKEVKADVPSSVTSKDTCAPSNAADNGSSLDAHP
jgi:hypothetical protein